MAESLESLWSAFELELQIRARSDKTINTYGMSPKLFGRWLEAQGLPADASELTRARIRDWLAGIASAQSKNTLATRHTGMRRWCRWLHAEGLIADDPMVGMQSPEWEEPPVPIIDDAMLTKLVNTAAGKGFYERRDTAIIRLLADCAPRVSEMCSIRLDDAVRSGKVLDEIPIIGKGGKPRTLYPGFKTQQALWNYVRARNEHRLNYLPSLLLSQRGGLTSGGVRQMLHARGKLVGLDELHPHMLRHVVAHDHQLNGGNLRSLEVRMGWKPGSRMTARYGASAAAARAKAETQQMRRGDRF